MRRQLQWRGLDRNRSGSLLSANIGQQARHASQIGCVMIENGNSVESEWLEGTVKWYSIEKVYGFIELVKGGPDVFVHLKQLRLSGITEPLKEGDKVRFKAEKGNKGLFATEISVISHD
jgi:CspA family cold shock protein